MVRAHHPLKSDIGSANEMSALGQKLPSHLSGLVVLALIVASVGFTMSHNFSLAQSARSVQ
jgi:hypothetical protein